MIDSGPNTRRDPIEAAARFVAEEPGWIDRALAQHIRRNSGDCAACGDYRPVQWPCVLVHIANRAAEMIREHPSRSSRCAASGSGRWSGSPLGAGGGHR